MPLGWYHVVYTLEGGFLGGYTYMAAGELEIGFRSVKHEYLAWKAAVLPG